MCRFLLICLAGAIGTGARYLIGSAFPFGTLIVNVIGSFLIAVIVQTTTPGDLRLVLATGLMGGFTTYSAFNFETASYLRQGAWLAGLGYAAATLIICLLAGFAGLAAGRFIAAR